MILSKLFIFLFFILLIVALENFLPYFKNRTKILTHDLSNFSLAICNGLLFALVFSFATNQILEFSKIFPFGISHLLSLPKGFQFIIVFLLFDCWMYLWHLLNHKISFLWRFHRVHHSDREMDSSTGLRFHPIEVIFSSIIRFAIIPIIGMNFFELMSYELIFLPIVLFHHSNIFLPERIDRVLRAIIVTPNMHRVHHSIKTKETNSNFSSIFSFWDRIFFSFQRRKNTLEIQYGLPILQESKWQTFLGMIITPFEKDTFIK